jgi:hypothetical protein
MTVSLDHTHPVLHLNTVFRSHFNSSQADFLYSSVLLVPIRSAGVRLNFLRWIPSRISLRYGPHRRHSLSCWNVFTEPLHSNGRSTDFIEIQLRNSHLARPLACWLFPSNSYKHPSYCWARLREMFVAPLPSYTRYNKNKYLVTLFICGEVN